MKTMILLEQKFMASLHEVYNRIMEKVQGYLDDYPYITFFLLIIGLTLFVLAAVTILTVALILPISLIFGWI